MRYFIFLKHMKALVVRYERYFSASSCSSFCMIPSMLTMSLSRLRCLPTNSCSKDGKTVNIFTKFTFRWSLENGRLQRFGIWILVPSLMNMNPIFPKCLVKHGVQCKLVQLHSTCSQDSHQDDNQEEKEDADEDADHQGPPFLNMVAVYTRIYRCIQTEEYQKYGFKVVLPYLQADNFTLRLAINPGSAMVRRLRHLGFLQ